MQGRTIRRSMTSVLLIIIGCYCAVLVAMFLWQGKLVFVPSTAHVADPSQLGFSFDDVWLTAADGVRTHAWYVPAASTTARTVLFFHGNAGNISHRSETLQLYHRLGLNVLMSDYRGYGRSEGNPSERGTELDALAAWQYLRQQRGTAASAILIHGRSLGGAIALALVEQIAESDNPIGAVIVESSFTSLPDVGALAYPWLPVRWLARIYYPNQARIARVRAPLLIAHATADEVIPFHHGQLLHAAAPTGAQFLSMRGGHNDGFLATGTEYVEALNAFINQHLQ
ncbi:MAG: fermentation-respiration switch protein FrsA (DUF1100 family) [Gammaproteobacteria bacterium]|jgi:fermentation-respiration switch protein FrsA (DUF1100 family)